jgi:sec-independent protein translocase protein TatA
MLGAPELILILIIVVMLFGAKRIPEIMNGIGQGIKSFKKAMEEENPSETRPVQPEEPPPTQTSPQQGNEHATASKEKIEPK